MSFPFFIYDTNKTPEEHKQKIKNSKASVTSFEYTNKITDKMLSYRALNYFSPETSTWITTNANEIKMLNVFVMALTYEIIHNLNKINIDTKRTKKIDIFSKSEIKNEFMDDKYGQYKDFLIQGKNVNRILVDDMLLHQIYVYADKIDFINNDHE